jgi:DNA processing protein
LGHAPDAIADNWVDAARQDVLEALRPTPAPVDAVICDLGHKPQTALTMLLELELAGRIERRPGNMVALIGKGEDP